MIPENDSMQSVLEMIFWTGFFVGIIFMVIPSFLRHPTVLTMIMIIRYLKVSGVMIILRTLSYLATSLPAPDDNCQVDSKHYDPPKNWTELFQFNNVSDSCGDLIFSGHVGLTLTMMICVIHYYYIMFPMGNIYMFILVFIQLPILMVIMAMVEIARTHYTVDIFIALYTVPLLYHFLWYQLPDIRIEETVRGYTIELDSEDEFEEDENESIFDS